MAQQGPFSTYAPPAPYTTTTSGQQVTGPPSGLQIPIFIGTGKESLSQTDFELVRGSSASIDQEIFNETVSDRFVLETDDIDFDNPELGEVDGLAFRFQVENGPIVVGDGRGITTNRPQDVEVTVDNIPVVVAAVDGARGIVTLQVPPPEGASVKATYSFNRTDTLTEDNVSEQVTDTPAIIKGSVPESYDIVAGANDELRLQVNGQSGLVTLDAGMGQSASDIASSINVAQIDGLTATVDLDNQGQLRVELQADGSLRILDSSSLETLGFNPGQRTHRNREFHVYKGPIVDGTDGGVTTTDPQNVTVTVNGQVVPAEEVDGANRLVVLAEPPVVGSTVEISYYHNTFDNTFDYLPNRDLLEIDRLGDSPDRNDYIQGLDYILHNDTILWGSAVTVESGEFTPAPGTVPFDDTQVSVELVDNRIFLEEVERLLDRSVSPSQPSQRTVILAQVPTDGSGRDNPTSDVNKVKIYHGSSISKALVKGAVEVTKVNPDSREITVKEQIPFGDKIFATYHYNRLQDDTYTLSRTTGGLVKVQSRRSGQVKLNARFLDTNSTETVQWPSGVESRPDAFISGSDGIRETVTVTFDKVGEEVASFTNAEAGPYDIFAGSSDSFGMEVNDAVESVSNQALDVDLSQPAFAVMTSKSRDLGSDFVVTAGENDIFSFRVDDENYSVTFPAGTHNIATVAEFIWRQLPATLLGTVEESFDIVLGTNDTFDFDLNGIPVSVTLTAGIGVTASTIAGEINTAIDGTVLTSGDPRDVDNLYDGRAIAENGQIRLEASESLVIGVGDANTDLGFPDNEAAENIKIVRTWEGSEKEYLLLRSRVIPQGPSDESSVRVLTGNANDLLGFENLALATGAESAVNKGATLLSSSISSGMISNLDLQQPDFDVFIDGDNFVVDGSAFAGVISVSDVVTVIDNVLSSVATTEEDDGHIRITSLSTTSNSVVEIGTSLANAYLGFSDGEVAGQRRPGASDIVAVLNNDTTAWANQGDLNILDNTVAGDFIASLYAQIESVAGIGDFIKVTSFNSGQDVSFVFDSSTPNTVFNDTGIGIEDGEGASGVDGIDGFDVTSDRTEGSSGTGVVGQTYTDQKTGLRFTVKGSEGAEYTSGDEFRLRIEENMLTGSTLVNSSIDGVRMTISNLGDVAPNDTAIVETFDKGGEEPGIGDFYYITYDYAKTDFNPRLFTRFREVSDNYGELGPENPLSLAAYLALLNGASIVAAKQVKKSSDSDAAPTQAYIDSLDELRTDIQPGIAPDIIVPLNSDPQVMAAVTKHCEVQSTPRNRNERRAIFGVASGTRPQDARELASNLNSERVMLLYPDSALMTLTNAVGEDQTIIVDGTFIAAALAGKMVSPANDVATPWTRRQIVGFDRLNRTLDETIKNQLATSGVTVIQDRDPFLEVRHGLTTNMDSILTRTPSVIAIKDFVQQQSRSTLDSFIGLKFLTEEAQNVELAMTGLLNSLVENQIITSFQGVSAEPDPRDPTMLRVEAFYSPVFPLLYIKVAFTISSGTQ